MNANALIAAAERLLPVIAHVAETLKLNKAAADLVRRIARDLVAAAAKTPTPIDDALVIVAAAVLNHVADMLDAGDIKEALGLLEAIGKLAH